MEPVELIDSMGDDLTVVNAARVSMHKESRWESHTETDATGTLHTIQRLSDGDRRLVQYLATHRHWTPFSHVMLTLRIQMPIFVARQWYRHTVGFARNEVSRRYVSEAPSFYLPTGLRKAAEHVKQGSSQELHHHSEAMIETAARLCQDAADFYEKLLDDGVAPEQARMFLPQNMMTEFVETASLYAYARLCRERLNPHAQQEIREYAELAAAKCAEVAPASWAALLGFFHD